MCRMYIRNCYFFESYVEFVAENSFKCLIKKRYVATSECLTMKIVRNNQKCSIAFKIKFERFNSADPGVISDVSNFSFAVRAKDFPSVVE